MHSWRRVGRASERKDIMKKGKHKTSNKVKKGPPPECQGLNNVGKIIAYQDYMGASNGDIGRCLGMSDEGWRQVKKKYADSEGEFEYLFTLRQIEELSSFLEIPFDKALVHTNSPLVFDEVERKRIVLDSALKRDYILTEDMLRCISVANEEDLPILQQTVNLLVGKTELYDNRFSLYLLGAARNALTKKLRSEIPNDQELTACMKDVLPKAKKAAREADRGRIQKEYTRKCLNDYIAEKGYVREEMTPEDWKTANEAAEERCKQELEQVLKEETYKDKEAFEYFLHHHETKLVVEELKKRIMKDMDVILTREMTKVVEEYMNAVSWAK